jgi:hypothetical protein
MIALTFGTFMMLHRQEKMWLHHKLLGVARSNSVTKKPNTCSNIEQNN